jgi:hypothetical protein
VHGIIVRVQKFILVVITVAGVCGLEPHLMVELHMAIPGQLCRAIPLLVLRVFLVTQHPTSIPGEFLFQLQI